MAPREEGIAPIQAVASSVRGAGLDPGAELAVTPLAVTRQTPADPRVAAAPPRGEEQSAPSRLEIEGTRLSIEKDEATGKLVTRLRDPDTDRVIRQIPAEETLKIAEWVDRYLGLFVDRHQ